MKFCVFGLWHLGYGVPRSAKDIVVDIGRILNTKVTIKSDRSRFRNDEFHVEYADISKLKALGWGPAQSLRTGLQRTMPYYLKHR